MGRILTTNHFIFILLELAVPTPTTRMVSFRIPIAGIVIDLTIWDSKKRNISTNQFSDIISKSFILEPKNLCANERIWSASWAYSSVNLWESFRIDISLVFLQSVPRCWTFYALSHPCTPITSRTKTGKVSGGANLPLSIAGHAVIHFCLFHFWYLSSSSNSAIRSKWYWSKAIQDCFTSYLTIACIWKLDSPLKLVKKPDSQLFTASPYYLGRILSNGL